MIAGTRYILRIIASRSMAKASPNPNSLMSRCSPRTKLPKTQTMIAAAAVITQQNGQPEPPSAKTAVAQGKGYQLTAHVRNYYRTAKV